MENPNNKGQILIEVCLVMALVLLIFFAAFSHLSKLKSAQQRHQFTKEKSYVSKDRFKSKR